MCAWYLLSFLWVFFQFYVYYYFSYYSAKIWMVEVVISKKLGMNPTESGVHRKWRVWRWGMQASIGLSLGAWPCAHPLTTQGRFLPNSVPGSQLQTVVTWRLPGRCLAEALCPDQLLSTEGHHSCPSIAISQLFASGYQKKCPCGTFQTGFLKGFHM